MKKTYSEFLTKLGASIKRRKLTNFLENAEYLGYYGDSALVLLHYLQGGAS
jgi:hypothetical protein